MLLRALIVVVAAWTGALLLRMHGLDPAFGALRSEVQNEADFIRSPGREVLQLASFEHPLAWADFVWLAMVQETGKREPSWKRVVRWTEVGTDLDPKYFTIYHSAAIHLALYGRMVERADALLLKGWAQLPERWQLPMLLGYNAYFIRGDALAGSDYMREAGETAGSPPYLIALSGRMRFHAGDAEGAIGMLESMLPLLEGPAQRDAQERILILKSEPILKSYDRACSAFREARAVLPTARQLFQEGWVSDPPMDLLEGEIILDEKCIARTEVIKVREFEAARERVGAQGRSRPVSIPSEILPPELAEPIEP